jgi:Aspartyl protease
MIENAGRTIRVVLAEPGGGAARNFVGCPPVTFVHLAADPDWARSSHPSPRHNGETYRAMIDTGADAVFVRPEVAAEIGAALTGNGTAQGIGEPQAGVRRATIQIMFPGANVVFVAPDAAVMPFLGDRRSFDLILGRQFLNHCRLLVDGPNSTYRLQWIG